MEAHTSNLPSFHLLYEKKPALVEGGIGIFGAIYRANAWNLDPERVFFSIPHIIEKLYDENEKIRAFAEEILRTAKEPYASQIAALRLIVTKEPIDRKAGDSVEKFDFL